MESFPINDLPEEILQHIFSFLSVSEKLKVCLVCKKWLNVLNCKYLLRNIIVKVNDLSQITKFNLSRNFLNFSFKFILVDYIHYEFFNYISNIIEYISFEKCQVMHSEKLISFNDLYFENLRVLKVIDCDLWVLFSNLPNLAEFYLSGNSTITDDGLAILQKSMKKLQALTLYCPTTFDPKSYRRFYPQNVTYERIPSPDILSLPALTSFISERVSTLTELNLYFDINSHALETISCIENLHLYKISLENCHNCIRGLITLFKNQPSLKVLNLNGIMGLDGDILKALCSLLPNIEEICIGGGSFTDDSFTRIFQLKKLRKLNVSNNYASELGFLNAIQNFESAHLRYLNVSGIKIKTIDSLIHKCKNLVQLDLSYCIVSDELLHFISENLIHLQDLSLKKTDITDYGLTGVAEMKLNENEIQEVKQKNPKPLSNLKWLKKLKLNFCEKITDCGIVSAVRFQYLEYLDLTGCNITRQSIFEALHQENPSLKEVCCEIEISRWLEMGRENGFIGIHSPFDEWKKK